MVVRTASIGDPSVNRTLRETDQALVNVVDAVSPAVVNIDYKIGSQTAGTGTGFIYRNDGWIVTNDHVVGDRAEVNVTLQDGRKFTGKVTTAKDAQYDVAVVKIDATNLPTLNFADSDSIKPGQIAIAVGSPFGLESTVTIGHISAVGRGAQAVMSADGQRIYSGMIQTDAAINPGNSGGPLLDVDGDVVGINSMIYSSSAAMFGEPSGSVGIGFAITSKVAKTVADRLISTGKLERAFLGAKPDTLPPYRAKEMSLPGGAILTLDDSLQLSPARDAGLKSNDIVTKIDGELIKNELDVRTAMLKKSPGSTAVVTYIRDGKTMTTNVKLAIVPQEVRSSAPARRQKNNTFGLQMPDPSQGGDDVIPMPNQPGGVKLGAGVNELDSQVRSQFKVPADIQGVVVMSLAEGSLAGRVGLEVGDVITSINGKPVSSVAAVREVMATIKPGQSFKVEAQRFVGGSRQSKTLMVTG
jgi:serine protease Do